MLKQKGAVAARGGLRSNLEVRKGQYFREGSLFVFSADPTSCIQAPDNAVILRACDFFDLLVFSANPPVVFQAPHKAVILSGAPHRSIANKGLYGAESKDLGDAQFTHAARSFSTTGPASIFPGREPGTCWTLVCPALTFVRIAADPVVGLRWLKSPSSMGKLSIAEVLRLRA